MATIAVFIAAQLPPETVAPMAFHLVLTLFAPLITCVIALMWAGYIDASIETSRAPVSRDLRTW